MPLFRVFCMQCEGESGFRGLDGPCKSHEIRLLRDSGQEVRRGVEVWEMQPAEFGDFVSKIPGPLGIGKVLLEDGSEVPGFIAEPRAANGAEEITRFGSWRAWLNSTT